MPFTDGGANVHVSFDDADEGWAECQVLRGLEPSRLPVQLRQQAGRIGSPPLDPVNGKCSDAQTTKLVCSCDAQPSGWRILWGVPVVFAPMSSEDVTLHKNQA